MPDDPKIDLPVKSSVVEHSISDADAQKFAAQGDYSLPMSPLDELLGDLKPDNPAAKPEEPIIEFQPLKLEKPTPPVPTVNDAPHSVPPSPPPPVPPKQTTTDKPVDLHEQAKAMMKTLEAIPPANGAKPPKKKRLSGAAPKMALAALLLVVFGGAGALGLRYMNTSQENRSQACGSVGTIPSTTYCNDSDGQKSYRATLANNDKRAIDIDAAKKKATQAKQCGKGIAGTNKGCGTSVNNAGCPAYNEDCAAVAKSNQAKCGKDDCSAAPAATANYTFSCQTGYYACNYGCCQTGGTKYEFCTDISASGSCNSWTQPTTDVKANINVLNKMLEERGLTTKDGVNYTTVINTATLKQMQAKFENVDGKSVSLADYCQLDSSNNPTNSLCKVLTGGYVYIGTTRGGTSCFPDTSMGGDYCTEVTGGGASSKVSCSATGLIRCKCPNNVWVVAVDSGQSCDSMCGSTDNVCESCKPKPPTPPSSSPSPLQCSDLTTDKDAPQIGDSVTFTCKASGDGANHYEFQYNVGGGNFTQLDANGPTKNTSKPLAITAGGDYTIECRVCSSTDDTKCTEWGMAQEDDN